jgi:DNA-binding MarR family transcriptional regulator
MRPASAQPATKPPPAQDAAPSAEPISELCLEIFRLNGALLALGDRVVAPLGLTSARWQVLGAVAYAPHPGPIAHVARAMGLTRQNVRRIVGDLVDGGMLALRPNPNHRRAPLVLLTPKGEAAFADAMRLWAPWTRQLAQAVTPQALATTRATLAALRERLTLHEEDEHDAP